MTDPSRLRIGTQEREDTLQALGEHFAAGRLPVDEYDQRVAKAVQAETRADVEPLFEDLPQPHPSFLAPPPPVPYGTPSPVPYNLPPPVPYDQQLSSRHKIPAGVLQLFLPFGIGRFYMGDTATGVAQLITAFFGVGVLWCWIDAIILLVTGGTDGEGRQLRG